MLLARKWQENPVLEENPMENGRGGEIRTHDLLYPKQARYQATLRPEPRAAEGAYPARELQPGILAPVRRPRAILSRDHEFAVKPRHRALFIHHD